MKKSLIRLIPVLLILILSYSVKAQPITGNYAIKNIKTGLLLRPLDASKKDGAPIVMYSPVNWKCLTWKFINEEDNCYSLENLFSGKTFQPSGQKSIKSAPLEQTQVANNQFQKWEFIVVKEATYKIRLKGTSLFITPADASGKINSGVILDAEKAGDLQLWTIYRQDPTI